MKGLCLDRRILTLVGPVATATAKKKLSIKQCASVCVSNGCNVMSNRVTFFVQFPVQFRCRQKKTDGKRGQTAPQNAFPKSGTDGEWEGTCIDLPVPKRVRWGREQGVAFAYIRACRLLICCTCAARALSLSLSMLPSRLATGFRGFGLPP